MITFTSPSPRIWFFIQNACCSYIQLLFVTFHFGGPRSPFDVGLKTMLFPIRFLFPSWFLSHIFVSFEEEPLNALESSLCIFVFPHPVSSLNSLTAVRCDFPVFLVSIYKKGFFFVCQRVCSVNVICFLSLWFIETFLSLSDSGSVFFYLESFPPPHAHFCC